MPLNTVEAHEVRLHEVKPSDAPPVAVLGSAVSPDLLASLRRLAFQRLDGEVFNHLRALSPRLHLAADDFLVAAAAIRAATARIKEDLPLGKPDRDIEELVGFVSFLAGCIALPARAEGSPSFRDYMNASIGWYHALRGTMFIQKFWDAIGPLLEMDLSPMPDLRERLLAELADAGRRLPLPAAISRTVLAYTNRPFVFSNPESYLYVLGYGLADHIAKADIAAITDSWLILWGRYLSKVRSHRMKRQTDALLLKNDIHRRLSMMARLSGILAGRYGGVRISLLLLLIKLDYWLFIRTKMAATLAGRFWLRLEQRVGRGFRPEQQARRRNIGSLKFWPRRVRRADRQLEATQTGLTVLNLPILIGTRRDIIVTRAQGGIGDVIMMRPGLLELRRRRRRGRVIFATNQAYFPAFSVDDPICLVDIEKTEIDVKGFGRWVDFTDCPAARVEPAQMPRVRTNRPHIFARALGIRLWPFQTLRIPPHRSTDAIETRANELLREHEKPGTKRIGIQLRAAETYRDVPAMMEAARILALRHSVFVFDNRPIPKTSEDRFIAIDNQKLPVAMAMASKCDVVVSGDSSFLHIAGTNEVPCLGVFGPTDGKVRRKGYSSVRTIDVRPYLACVPCWRNEFVKCKLSDGYESICMKMIPAQRIVDEVEKLVALRYENLSNPN